MKNYFILFVLFASTSLYAQSIAPSTINASGGAAIINSNTFEWSIAEMVEISSFNSGNNLVTAGLLQPIEDKLSVQLLHNKNISISIFPNPFYSLINLKIKSEELNNLKIIVKDCLGNLVYQEVRTLLFNNEIIQLNLSHLTSGTYVIETINMFDNVSIVNKCIKIN